MNYGPSDYRIAVQGLNITGYHGKWVKAMSLAFKNERQDDNRLLPYWERVRLIFLELGGQYVDQNERDRNGRNIR